MKPDRWQQVSQLYHAALAKDPNERGRFLAQTCEGDEALRRDVESLLAREATAEGFLAAPALEMAAKVMAEGAGGSLTLTGRQVGTYQIQSALGVGGMGEVYRARDRTLNRDVALKVLPEHFALDADRLARFKREAQVLASLNHPNIAAIYGLEESHGVRALVLELVEGPTLADRIARGPLPVSEALPIAQQIAEALEAAHEHGVIHRDLKPANVKVREDGTVKVLDFGLAKPLDSAPTAIDASHSPTITSPALLTGVGGRLGTAAYMSPEQARGKAVDKRSDLWAFGCVLYEMLTARRAFEGDEVSDTLAAILTEEPVWSRLPAETPSPIAKLLRRCLQKDRKHRLADAADARLEIDEALTPPASVTGLTTPDRGSVWRRAAIWAAGTLVIVAVAGTAIWLGRHSGPPRMMRFTIASSGPTAVSIGGVDRDLAITPDGLRVIYVGNNGRQLLVRALDQLEPTVIASGTGLRGIFVAPDGLSVGFSEGVTLKKVAITGGPSVPIARLPNNSRGAAWVPDDSIIFASGDAATGLHRIPAGGGDPTVLTRPDRVSGEADHLWPEVLPGGGAVLFTIAALTGLDAAQIAVVDLTTGEQKVILRGGSHAHYVSTGHLVYTTGTTLRAVGFDLNRLETRGAPVPVLSRLVTTALGAGDFGLAADGTLVYVDAPGAMSLTGRTLVWVDRKGQEQPIAMPPRAYTYPRLSPNGAGIAVFAADEQLDVWEWDLRRQVLTRLTDDPALDSNPLWTPDGRHIVFSSQRTGVQNLFWQAADGTGTAEPLTKSSKFHQPTGVSRDGTRIVFHQGPAPRDLMLLTLDAARRVEPLLQTPFDERNGVISPDERWLAYESNSSGQFEIYVRPFPNVSGGQWRISTAGGTQPLWAGTGRELFYIAPDGALMAVGVEARGAAWSASAPTKLFEGRYVTASGSAARMYDVSPDGERFVMVKQTADSEAASPQIVIVQNWTQELKRLVPSR